ARRSPVLSSLVPKCGKKSIYLSDHPGCRVVDRLRFLDRQPLNSRFLSKPSHLSFGKMSRVPFKPPNHFSDVILASQVLGYLSIPQTLHGHTVALIPLGQELLCLLYQTASQLPINPFFDTTIQCAAVSGQADDQRRKWPLG